MQPQLAAQVGPALQRLWRELRVALRPATAQHRSAQRNVDLCSEVRAWHAGSRHSVVQACWRSSCLRMALGRAVAHHCSVADSLRANQSPQSLGNASLPSAAETSVALLTAHQLHTKP